MIVCKDCGKRNLATLYCVKCGADLYAKHRRPEREPDRIFERLLGVK